MHPLIRLEYEPKSCAIVWQLFISESLICPPVDHFRLILWLTKGIKAINFGTGFCRTVPKNTICHCNITVRYHADSKAIECILKAKAKP